MTDIAQSFAENPELLLGLILGGLGMCLAGFIAALIASTAVKRTREREQSRREIAAYVAEGTLSAGDAENLLSPRPWWSRGAAEMAGRVRKFGCEAVRPPA